MSRRLRDALESGGLTPSEAQEVVVSESDADPVLAGVLTTDAYAGRINRDYMHCVNPDTGLEVVFVPGEALPEWAQKVQESRLRPAGPRGSLQATARSRRPVKAVEADEDGK